MKLSAAVPAMAARTLLGYPIEDLSILSADAGTVGHSWRCLSDALHASSTIARIDAFISGRSHSGDFSCGAAAMLAISIRNCKKQAFPVMLPHHFSQMQS